jgi:hypothetical protein
MHNKYNTNDALIQYLSSISIFTSFYEQFHTVYLLKIKKSCNFKYDNKEQTL